MLTPSKSKGYHQSEEDTGFVGLKECRVLTNVTGLKFLWYVRRKTFFIMCASILGLIRCMPIATVMRVTFRDVMLQQHRANGFTKTRFQVDLFVCCCICSTTDVRGLTLQSNEPRSPREVSRLKLHRRIVPCCTKAPPN